ncbi:MAG: PAS domain S-box protein, partial [Arenibacterium sp.]
MEPVQDTALLAALMEAAVDAIIIADDHGQILRVSPAAAKLFGYTADAMVGRNVNILMPETLAKLHDGFMAHHLATGEKRIIGTGREVEGQRQDGKIIPLHLSVGSAEVADRKMFVAILHDLTDRHAAQAALARSQRLDAIGQLTGGIAHDFNNLLTVVIGNLELVQMRGVEARHEALIADALDAAEMGADLTSRLLVFARKGNLKPMQVDLRSQCRDALAILRRTIGERYTIRTEFAETVSPVMID